MRYRKLSDSGDYVIGHGPLQFLINTPECVAQAVSTRLSLGTGDWFLDTDEGTPYRDQILGENTRELYDSAIQNRILGTQGVQSITSYSSIFDADSRALSVTCVIDTIYGQAAVEAVI